MKGKKREKLLIVVMGFFLVLAVMPVTAYAVTGTINYQGFLTDDEGAPETGPVDMIFKICSEDSPAPPASCTSSVWDETHTGVTGTNGIFNVILGSINPIESSDLDGNGWLEVTVNGGVLGPRQQLTSVAYSIRAGTAESVVNDGVGSAQIVNYSIISEDIADFYVGDAGTGGANTFIGNTAGSGNTTGSDNTFIGYGAGDANTEGVQNTFIGSNAGANSTGIQNTFIGHDAGRDNTGDENTFIGEGAGPNNTSAIRNTFVGRNAGGMNTQGSYNTFLGYGAGFSNTTAHQNTFVGGDAGLYNNADNNTFIGTAAGYYNTTGFQNTFIGPSAGYHNVSTDDNTFIGFNAGYSNNQDPAGEDDGRHNVFIGSAAGSSNTTGNHNVFIGSQVGVSNTTAGNNVFIGYGSGDSNATGSDNTFVGTNAGDNNNANSNTFIGGYVGLGNTTGHSNTFIGGYVGQGNTTGFENTFVGTNAGKSNTYGEQSTYIGFEAGLNNTGGMSTYIGYQAGVNETEGWESTFIGYQAGRDNNNGYGNTFVGHLAGIGNKTGSGNTSLGYLAGGQHPGYGGGNCNVSIGTYTGNNNIDASNNTYVGYYAGSSNGNGEDNTFIGYRVGFRYQGSNNTFIGSEAGFGEQSVIENGTGNVFLGYRAGYYETGSNKLYIANSNTDTPLIYGDFSNGQVRVNGEFGIGIGTEMPTSVLDVGGSARLRGVPSLGAQTTNYLRIDTTDGRLYQDASDSRLKTNIKNIEDGLEIVKKLQGVRFNWKKDPEGKPGIGLIAQDAEKVIPELTFTNSVDGYKGINYPEITAVLIEAVKDQQKIIDELSAKLDDLEESKTAEIESLRNQLTHLRILIETVMAQQPGSRVDKDLLSMTK